MNKNRREGIVPGTLIALLTLATLGQAENTTSKPAVKPALKAEAVATPPVRYSPANRRDPFINPLLLKKAADDLDTEVARSSPPPGISGMYVAEVRLVGISLQDEGRTAVFRGPDKRVYFLQEGDHLFDGFVKTIGADSVQLVRETKLKSGKTLTQDVQKKLRTP